MKKIGIICPSEIAERRFLPALKTLKKFHFVGVAIANSSEWQDATSDMLSNEFAKAQTICKKFGGKVFESYQNIIDSPDIDAIYLPLPPALHYIWAKKALMAGKHVLIEKPATIKLAETVELIKIAKERELVMHENYMFVYHQQLESITEIVKSGKIGDVRLYRLAFGFPRRLPNDFRYNKELGGGALLDAGGYSLKYASMLLGKSAKLAYAQANYIDDFDVDIFGSAALVNNEGTVVQIAFGMDNSYKCDLEVWGSIGSLFTGRVITAPAGFNPELIIKTANGMETINLQADDAFSKSIDCFYQCIHNDKMRLEHYNEIFYQANLVQDFMVKSNMIEI